MIKWEEDIERWTLHSQAKVIEVDREWEGPCRRDPQVQVFTDFAYHRECMQHCQKISRGRVPPVNTKEDWESLTREIDLITPDYRSSIFFPLLWLSATEGDVESKLGELDHWPETEVVNNETIKLEAVETVWRDFYTGQRLDNWTKPYYIDDATFGDTANCMLAATFIHVPWDKSWTEGFCQAPQACPCSYPAQPILRLRGLCRNNVLFGEIYSPKQLPANPGNMILLGAYSSRIEYNDTNRQWILTSAEHDVTARSRASKVSYVLGKHKWTISNDAFECYEGKSHTTFLKLSGCAEDEFTCDDGQCIKMERRCDQVTGKEPNCRDESDEEDC